MGKTLRFDDATADFRMKQKQQLTYLTIELHIPFNNSHPTTKKSSLVFANWEDDFD